MSPMITSTVIPFGSLKADPLFDKHLLESRLSLVHVFGGLVFIYSGWFYMKLHLELQLPYLLIHAMRSRRGVGYAYRY